MAYDCGGSHDGVRSSMLEGVFVIAAIVTVVVGGLQVYQFVSKRTVPRSSPRKEDPVVSDRWVNIRYVDEAGISAELRGQGYKLHWVGANREAQLVDLRGWEYVEREDGDGRRYRLKVRDESVGGYLVLLKHIETPDNN